MNVKDTAEMIDRCVEEIKTLRNIIARLEPKAHAYDHMCVMLDLLPQRAQPMGEDIVWRLDRQRRELMEETKVRGEGELDKDALGDMV